MKPVPIDAGNVPPENRRMTEHKAVFYLGDGVYAAPDRYGSIILSTYRDDEGGEHHITLDPEVIARLSNLMQVVTRPGGMDADEVANLRRRLSTIREVLPGLFERGADKQTRNMALTTLDLEIHRLEEKST